MSDKINAPFVKKPENVQWLQENEEIFRNYVANDSSPYALVTALLHDDYFNDNFVETVKHKLYDQQKKILKSEEKIKQQAKKNKAAEVKKTKTEKEIIAATDSVVRQIEEKLKEEEVEFDD